MISRVSSVNKGKQAKRKNRIEKKNGTKKKTKKKNGTKKQKKKRYKETENSVAGSRTRIICTLQATP